MAPESLIETTKLITRSRIQKLWAHPVAQNLLSLYGVQAANYILPFVTVPYLTRVLGAHGWGLVAFAQAFAAYIVLIGEYGFALSASREVARNRQDRNRLTSILAGVMGAKAMLAGGGLILATLLHFWLPIFRAYPALLWAAMFFAVAQTFSMMWYFQGMERMRVVAVLDVGFRILAVAGIFLLVRIPGDEWKVPALQGVSSFLATSVALGFAYREVPFRMPSWNATCEALRMGWSMFLFRGAVSMYTAGNAFILGLFASPHQVGYYAGAEKMAKGVLGLLGPVSQTLYPRISQLAVLDKGKAARLARTSLLVMGTGGILLGIAVFLIAPVAVRIILGSGFDPAVVVLRVLAFLPPLIALSNVLGIQWMLPLGLDRSFNRIIMCAGLLNLVLAIMLAPRYAHVGMAIAVLASEILVTSGIYVLLRWRGLDPVTFGKASASKA